MGTSTSKKSTKKEVESKSNSDVSEKTESKGKSQKVKILVSVFRYGDKIVSALGIPNATSPVSHRIPKNKLKDDELFNIISAITNDKYFSNDLRWKEVAKKALNKNYPEISFPAEFARDYNNKSIGKLQHEILSIEIELLLK